MRVWMADGNLYTLSDVYRHELKIKRSTFIGTVAPARSKAEAQAFVRQISNEFHDASHNCFAYRMDPSSFRYSDDGEPSGTAGRPILSMIEKYQFIQVVLVVTRYFGGIQLGTGGLSRAYARAAEETLQKVSRRPVICYQQLRLHYDYSFIRAVRTLLEKYGGKVVESEYQHQVHAVVEVPREFASEFQTMLQQQTAGRIVVEECR